MHLRCHSRHVRSSQTQVPNMTLCPWMTLQLWRVRLSAKLSRNLGKSSLINQVAMVHCWSLLFHILTMNPPPPDLEMMQTPFSSTTTPEKCRSRLPDPAAPFPHGSMQT